MQSRFPHDTKDQNIMFSKFPLVMFIYDECQYYIDLSEINLFSSFKIIVFNDSFNNIYIASNHFYDKFQILDISIYFINREISSNIKYKSNSIDVSYCFTEYNKNKYQCKHANVKFWESSYSKEMKLSNVFSKMLLSLLRLKQQQLETNFLALKMQTLFQSLFLAFLQLQFLLQQMFQVFLQL